MFRKYKITQESKNLNEAWDIYYHVFRRISRQLPQLTSLELQYVSPKLTECTDLELAVPGSYNPKHELICIAKVEPQLNIITSKQRPRKLTIKGSNGKNYMFLLKGHEDLRQDERVMQLFGLVNSLLNTEISTSKQNLGKQRLHFDLQTKLDSTYILFIYLLHRNSTICRDTFVAQFWSHWMGTLL